MNVAADVSSLISNLEPAHVGCYENNSMRVATTTATVAAAHAAFFAG
jgi:hypothetical protein